MRVSVPSRRYSGRVPGAGNAHPPRFRYRALPLWLQWALPFTIAIIAVIALVVWVNHETNDVPSEAPVSNRNAIVQQNKQAEALMKQLQAPHTATLRAGATPANALKGAITAWLDTQIRTGQIDGPLKGGRCSQTAGSSTARVALRCTMVTADVNYPFYGVVEPRHGLITFCQRVTPPIYGMDDFPLSGRCLGSGVH